MPNREFDQSLCDRLIQKFSLGEPLSADERVYLAGCSICMDRIVSALDESPPPERSFEGESNDGTARDRPSARKALEQGVAVFERAFGITAPHE